MKLSRLVLAAALAAVWAALPLAARAEDDDRDGGEETVEVRKHVRQDDGDREGGKRERREGMGGREGRDGPRGQHGMDPETKEKLDKMRDLEMKARDLAMSLRKGTDVEKAAAKSELKKTIGELFDAKLALETAMLANLERNVTELKAKIAKKKSSREKAIERRFMRMSGDGDEWD